MSKKPIWWQFHYVVWLVKEASIAFAAPEDIATAEQPDDVDISVWLPRSRIRGAKVTHKMENGIWIKVEEVEKKHEDLKLGDHVSEVKIPVWLARSKEKENILLEPCNPEELKAILDKKKAMKKSGDASTLPWNQQTEKPDDKPEPEQEGTPEVQESGEEAPEAPPAFQEQDFQEEKDDDAIKGVLRAALEDSIKNETVEGTETNEATEGEDVPGGFDIPSEKSDGNDEMDPTELW